jgi:hypothetical protein
VTTGKNNPTVRSRIRIADRRTGRSTWDPRSCRRRWVSSTDRARLRPPNLPSLLSPLRQLLRSFHPSLPFPLHPSLPRPCPSRRSEFRRRGTGRCRSPSRSPCRPGCLLHHRDTRTLPVCPEHRRVTFWRPNPRRMNSPRRHRRGPEGRSKRAFSTHVMRDRVSQPWSTFRRGSKHEDFDQSVRDTERADGLGALHPEGVAASVGLLLVTEISWMLLPGAARSSVRAGVARRSSLPQCVRGDSRFSAAGCQDPTA